MGLQGTTVYFLTVSELQAQGPGGAESALPGLGQSGARHAGHGTAAASGIQFLIADPASQPLPVVYRGGQVPDIIGDNIEIVAEGKLDAQGTFTANNVLAKCPSRLENAPPEEHDYAATAG